MCTQDQRCDSGTQIIACVPRMMADACIRHNASCKPKLASIRRLELPFPKSIILARSARMLAKDRAAVRRGKAKAAGSRES